MKRLSILAVGLVIILAVLQAVCLGQPLKTVRLAEPTLTGNISLEQALARRRSVRQFTQQKLDFTQIGQLAWAGQGITEPKRGFRTAPSAGALYPIKLYLATQQGIFVYHPEDHTLKETFNQDIRRSLAIAALRQEAPAEAACDIIIAGSERKLAVKYRDKARRYMLLEAGHIAQNIQLQAVCLGLASVPIGAFDIDQVHKVCRLPADLEPLLIVCVGYPALRKESKELPGTEIKLGKEKKEIRRMDREVKKAVLIIASRNFRDEELFETKRQLEKANVDTVIASSKTGLIMGMLGRTAQATLLINDIVVDDYDAIIFVGGSGASEYFNSPVALNIARQAADKEKVLAAICIAPTVLANAGLLDGVTATSFSSEQSKLKRAGARYTGAAVKRDGLIITGRGPEAASQFGKTIASALTDR